LKERFLMGFTNVTVWSNSSDARIGKGKFDDDRRIVTLNGIQPGNSWLKCPVVLTDSCGAKVASGKVLAIRNNEVLISEETTK
jgi:hypothetical protein